ncbi:hypothetical protein BLNAU_2366 [Blattamonas nauphoetae]|uniref:Uncharacterized protein n=1 Tax=Blattamonas nauphoetae TaxID=2049346 RepID=A0ABQ9YFI8_9EUKA|nr:hypothetical protein BLNAU_2366 [Blattamonas nauphoetae]
MIRSGFLDTPINTRERNNLLNDCTTCGWRQLILDIIPTATFLTKERLADIFTRDVISVIISAKSKPSVPLFSIPSLISSLIVSATLFSNGPFYELSTRLYQLVLRLCASINDTRTMSTVVRNQYWLVGLHGKGFRQLDKEYMWKTVKFEALDRMMKLLRVEYANLVSLANKERPIHAYIARRKEIQKSLASKSQPAKEDELFHQPPLTVFPENEMTMLVHGRWIGLFGIVVKKADCAFSAYDLLFEDNIPQYPTGVSSAKIDARLADLGIDYYPAPAALPSVAATEYGFFLRTAPQTGNRGISNRRVLDDHCDSINHISGPDSFWISPARADNEECDPQTVLDQWKELHCSERACSASLTSLTVQGITQKGESGNGAFARLLDASSISVSSSTFAGVTSVGDGGVFFSTSSGSISLSSCSFTSCSCGSGHQGKWVQLGINDRLSRITCERFAADGEDLAEAEGSTFRSISLLFYLIDFKAATITTGDGKDAKGCGQFPRILVVSTQSQLSRSLEVSETTVELKPKSTTGTIRIGKTGSFVVSVHSLSPTSLSLVPAVSSEARDSSLFSVVGGSLAVKSCSFVDFSLSSHALIHHTGSTLKMDDVAFESIVRSDGSGSVVVSEMVSGMKLDLNDVRLIDVSSSNGKFDGIFVQFGSKSSPRASPEFNLTNLHFSATSSASLSTSNTDETAPCFLWIEGANLGFKDQLPTMFWIVGLDAVGISSPHCGFFAVWCPTLRNAIARLASAESTTVQVQTSIVLSESVSFSLMKTLCGVNSNSTVTIESGCSFAVAESLPDVVVTISSLCFLLPQSITSDKLFAVTGGSLQVTSCSFSPKGEYPFSFQLICGSAHQVTLESTNVSSASLSSVALISTSCSVSMSNCRFSSIVVLEGHGSVLRADASNTARVSVLNTVLSGCSSSGVGSAILLSKLNGGSFSSTDWDGMFNLSSTMGEVLVFDASLRASKSNSSSLLYEFHPHVAGNPI